MHMQASVRIHSFYDLLTNPYEIPGPRGLELFLYLAAFRANPLPAFSRAREEYGDLVYFPLWQALHFSNYRFFFLASRPDDIHHVLKINHKNYRKSKNYQKLQPILGEGLLTSEGDVWQKQRQMTQPLFGQKYIATFAATMRNETQKILERWETAADQGKPIDLAEEMMQLTLQIVGWVFFSTDLSGKANRVGKALTRAINLIQKRVTNYIDLPKFLPTPENIKLALAIETLDEIVFGMIEERRKQKEKPLDLLSLLIAAGEEQGSEGLSNQQLRDAVMTFFLAGHETTANALTWFFYLLSQNPGAEGKIAEEARAQSATCTYTRMAIQESLRLYPPAWLIERTAVEEDSLGGYPLPAGSLVLMSPYLTHRHPDYWRDPEKFEPERFSPEHEKNIHPCSYFPFGMGPRHCIGKHFALLEMELIVTTILRSFHLKLFPNFHVEPDAKVTLRPRNGMKMLVQRRGSSLS